LQDNYIVVIFTSLFGQYNVQKIYEPTIIPVATNEDYSIDNGLLLEKEYENILLLSLYIFIILTLQKIMER
jgi:hypothetical protein